MTLSARIGRVLVALGLVWIGAPASAAEEPPVFAEANEVRPLLVGLEIPDGTLKDEKGNEVAISELRDGGPAVFVFYRGHW